ncbi:tetratricopeptide repeat protein [Formosa sp. S-31]|uniref:tetratricopeptide repeat protein n=1 Tax=Formosa sp. S-31 TaxID=2790949 RepID=UPI003EBBDA63
MKKLFVLLFFIGSSVFAQDQKTTKADSVYFAKMYLKAEQYRESNLDSSLYYYQKLNTFLKEKKYVQKQLRILLDIGNLYVNKGQTDRAMDTYLKILEEAEEVNNSQYKLYAEISIAGIYLESEDYRKALDLYKKIREDQVVTDSTSLSLRPYCAIYNNEGIANENLGNYEEAEKLYHKSIELSKKISEFYLMANAISNMGSLQNKLGHFQEALNWHEQALEIRERENIISGICQSLTHIGKTYVSLGEMEKAEDYLLRALDTSTEVGLSKNTLETAIALKTIYENKQDFQRAFQMQEQEMTARKEILNEESVKNQERLKADYEYELEKKTEEDRHRFKETMYQFGSAILILLLIIALILFLLQKSKTKRTQLLNENIQKEKTLLHKELDYKNKKLMSNLMFLLEKNELISSLTKDLKQTRKMTKQQSDKLISDTLINLNHHLNHQTWEEFDLYFQEVHAEFYSKLATNYQLTPNELKLAAFTKLNLSSKEISSLTGQSVRTIDVGRYRLRKKLNITNSEINLTTFLNSI